MKATTALTIDPQGERAVFSDAPGDREWLKASIPCQSACPAGTDIPGYLEAIYHGRFEQAYEINLRDNVFPAVLGRICSRPCESACRHGVEGNGDPVAICFSKRSAADFGGASPVLLDPLFRPSGKTVAIVGGGPAGLAAARELARFGHRVTVFERHARPGGMLTQGIPVFRLPRDVVQREIDQVLGMGVTLQCGVAVGTDTSLGELASGFDAVVLAAGTSRPNMLKLPGEDLAGVEHGLAFLLDVNELGRDRVGARTVVIGGGYTAMDCARTALRLGAQSQVHYRRSRADMVVLPGEVEELCVEGGLLHELCNPFRFRGEDGRLQSLGLVRMRAAAAGRDGRRGAVPIEGSEFDLDVDTVILATGQFPDTAWIDPDLQGRLVGADGWLASGTAASTAVENVFAAGDYALGATTVIQSIGHAKRCARAVDEYLTREVRVRDAVRVEPAFQSKVPAGRTTGRSPALNVIAVHPMPTIPVAQRNSVAEVEVGYPRDLAPQAASRCYLCHYKFEIDDGKCVLCDECIKVKPVPGCIVEIAGATRAPGAPASWERFEEGAGPSLYYSRLWIDQSKCIRCGACEAACPVNAITIQKVSLEARACAEAA